MVSDIAGDGKTANLFYSVLATTRLHLLSVHYRGKSFLNIFIYLFSGNNYNMEATFLQYHFMPNAGFYVSSHFGGILVNDQEFEGIIGVSVQFKKGREGENLLVSHLGDRCFLPNSPGRHASLFHIFRFPLSKECLQRLYIDGNLHPASLSEVKGNEIVQSSKSEPKKFSFF